MLSRLIAHTSSTDESATEFGFLVFYETAASPTYAPMDFLLSSSPPQSESVIDPLGGRAELLAHVYQIKMRCGGRGHRGALEP